LINVEHRTFNPSSPRLQRTGVECSMFEVKNLISGQKLQQGLDQMLEMLACIMMIIFMALGVYLWYPNIEVNAPINNISEVNPLNCWRFILCCFISSATALLIACFIFPYTNWKNKIWVSIATGLLPGLLIGWMWQWLTHKSLSDYLRRVVLIATFFSAAFFLYLQVGY